VLALYARVVGYPFLAFDDAEFILRNPQVTDPTSSLLDLLLTPKVGYPVPVTIGFEAALYQLAGGAAWAFHAAALALHAVYACQLLVLARKLGAALPVAFAASLLFAVHPLVVQPIAWAICLKDLLMANLVLGATLAFLSRASEPPWRASALAALTLAVLAMLAKPSAVLIGFAWLAYLLARRHQPASTPEECAPGIAPAAWAIAGCTAVLGALIGAASRFAHDTLLAEGGVGGWTAWSWLPVLGRQLSHVVWPVDLLVLYPDPGSEPAPWFAAAGAAALVLVTIALVRLRAEPGRVLVLTLAIAIYLPTSNLLPFARAISDSYMYLPLSCIALACALQGERWLSRRTGRARGAAALAAAALALALGASSSAQLPRWRGGLALWQPVVRRYPTLSTAHRLLGDELMFRGRPERAVDSYRRAFELEYDPRFLVEFGTVLGLAGKLGDAECVLIEAVAYGSNSGYAIYNYAALLAYHPDYEPRHPAIARRLLTQLATLRHTAGLAWPEPLEPGLQRQLARVRDVPAVPTAWPQRNCAVLKSR